MPAKAAIFVAGVAPNSPISPAPILGKCCPPNSGDMPTKTKNVGTSQKPADVAGISALSLSRPQQAILNALADFGELSVWQPHREHVALFAGASPSSSAYTNNLGALRTAGLIEYPAPGLLRLTDRGGEAAQRSGRILTQQALQQAWLTRLTGPQRRILEVLLPVHPRPVSRPELADRAGASASSSAFTNNLGALRSLGLLDYPSPGQVAATTLLFPDGLPEGEN